MTDLGPNDLTPDTGILGLTSLTPLTTDAQTTANTLFSGFQGGAPIYQPPVPNLIQSLGIGTETQPKVDKNYQRNLTTLTNKYREMSKEIYALPAGVRQALIDYDAKRVSQGSAPMTQEQTQLAAQTLTTGQQATPEPDRNPLNIFGNAVSDIGDILRSVPRLPKALVSEAMEIPQMSEQVKKLQSEGANPLEALLRAPGVRLIPGTYTAANLVGGPSGWSEAVSHPVMTVLDVLPAAHSIAGMTAAGKLATETAEAAARPARPITAALTGRVVQTVDPATGATIDVLGRNRLGQAVDTVRNETRIGQALDAFGGTRSRDTARIMGHYDQRLKSLALGMGTPEAGPLFELESFGPRVVDIMDRYSDQYPFLKKDAIGHKYDVERAQLYNDIQRDPSKYDPGLVSELRDLQVDIANYLTNEQLGGWFRGEFFDADTLKSLNRSQTRADHAATMLAYRNEYLNPSGQLTQPRFLAMVKSVMDVQDNTLRLEQAQALEHTLDAYGVDVSPMKGQRAALHTGGGSWSSWEADVLSALNDPNLVLSPRSNLTDIMAKLKAIRKDDQVQRLRDALKYGKRNEVTAAVKNIYSRAQKDPMFDQALRDDLRSMSKRMEFDSRKGSRYTDLRVQARKNLLERKVKQTAPARFHALLTDEVLSRGGDQLRTLAEKNLNRTLTAEEAGSLVRDIQDRQWRNLPGVSEAEATAMMQQIEKDVTGTWQYLKSQGHDPVFVHRVSPHRAMQTLTNKIGPVPNEISQVKERVLDLTTGVQDIQLSLTHQASELLAKRYSEMAFEDIIAKYGHSEADLRDLYIDHARELNQKHPNLSVNEHLSEIIKRSYEKFNPDEAGFSWGGARLNKYKQDAPYIPKALANNLHRYAKRPSIFSTVMDPITRAFRYNVIGLSPSVIINNFFSNAVAMGAESGLGPWQYWETAREWLRDPKKIPNEQLKAMMVAEQPHMEHLNTESWMRSRTGQKFMGGFNAGKAVQDSVFANTAGSLKMKLDAVVKKSLQIQQWSDNVYRAMQYMYEVEKGATKGLSPETAANRAMEMVRKTFVDYTSFTPIERNALRTIIPFYSYMGHAARFIMRYPLDHPVRASIASKLAAAEKDRLGALPGSWLSMFPLGAMGEDGMQMFFNLRPFSPFGDTADLATVSGWVAAMSPAIQVALHQIGVVRGEAELYPTLRYDPQTGRMRAVKPNVLTDILTSAIPRAGLVASVLGLNPDYNELRSRDTAAGNRSLLAQAGIPRAWRRVDVYEEMIRAELSRNQVAQDVLNDAMRTGNWSEAMRYPSLRAYYEQIQSLSPDEIAAMTPASGEDIASVVATEVGS